NARHNWRRDGHSSAVPFIIGVSVAYGAHPSHPGHGAHPSHAGHRVIAPVISPTTPTMAPITIRINSTISVGVNRRRPASLRTLTYRIVAGANSTAARITNFSPAASNRNIVYAVAAPATIVSRRRIFCGTPS